MFVHEKMIIKIFVYFLLDQLDQSLKLFFCNCIIYEFELYLKYST